MLFRSLAKLWQTSRADSLRLGVLRLATQWHLAAVDTPSLYAALRAPDNDELRIAGATALAVFAGTNASVILNDLAGSSRTPGERVAAALGIMSLDLPRAADIAADIFSKDINGKCVASLLPPFLQREGGTAALAGALAAKKPARNAAQTAMGLMSAGGRREETLVRLFAGAAGFNGQGRKMTPAEIAAFADEVRAGGVASRGAEIFRRAELGCASCHSVNGRGGHIGPDLSALGTAQPVEFIVGAILEPQKEIKEGFMSISVVTKDGEEYQGYPVRETGEELALRDVLQNKEIHLRRSDIKEKKQNGSLMPAGLADTLTQTEFRDLVRFLSGLGKPK